MTAAVVKLDSLPDAIRTTAKNHHLLRIRRPGFVLGLAHADVTLSATALYLNRPDNTAGFVVSTQLSPGETVDESSDVGTVRTAQVVDNTITSSTTVNASPTRRWRRDVAHRPTHRGNATLVAESVAPTRDTAGTRLVELNASFIVRAGAAGCGPDEALDRVREARRSGRAVRLLRTLAQSQ